MCQIFMRQQWNSSSMSSTAILVIVNITSNMYLWQSAIVDNTYMWSNKLVIYLLPIVDMAWLHPPCWDETTS